MIIRLFDVFFSFIGLILFLPLFLVVCPLILLSSRGGVFFVQERIGKNGKPFKLIKFRSMREELTNQRLITVGNDSRITPVGKFIRKFKIDELPQLLNVFKGEMSIVGPRPEVRKYVDLYTTQQKRVLSVEPGLTDYASISFFNESDILAMSPNPEDTYINCILPQKISLSLLYVDNRTPIEYFKIIILTIKRFVGNK